MNIALTYDLRDEYLALGYDEDETAEFDRVETIDALERALSALGHTVHRIGHARRLVEALARGERWDLVFNIAEGLVGFGREAQVPALLDVYGIPYTFSDPLTLSVCLHKGIAKTLAEKAGIPTPAFAVIEYEADLETVSLPFPLFAKPVAEGTGKGIDAASRIEGPEQLPRVCAWLRESYGQPVLLETYLPGREFTVGIVGTGKNARVLGTLEIILREEAEAGGYSYLNKEECESRVEYRLADDTEAARAAATALDAWRILGCRDGGRVDLRSDAAGRPQFMEVNPLAGLHPEHSDLPILCEKKGISYLDLIGMILKSALQRLRPGGGGT
ncbi:MAG TPA: D-alanine--D-alanine ligase [Spirochaetia bacterium]|nr:D-alanine--D-alanine ligase [Spirochaetia bacterium]